jgi:phosphinothricin acetyltransferase
MIPPVIDVRPATVDDLPAIVAIYNQAVMNTTATADVQPQTLEARRAWFDERTAQGMPIFVAVFRGEVVGWGALGRYHTRFGYRFTVENSVYVADDHKGHGVGQALLRELVAAAKRGGYHSIVAVLAGGNEASERLHARFGFVEMGRLRELIYKFDQWIDVVYFQLTLHG